MKDDKKSAHVAWEGDSLVVMREFPKAVREDLGAELRRLQQGEKPLNSRPMKSIGARVYEIKEQDERAWYRVIYLAKVEDTIYVLHCFEKQSAKTSPRDLDLAEARLKKVLARLREGKI
jgi:phage-related protein